MGKAFLEADSCTTSQEINPFMKPHIHYYTHENQQLDSILSQMYLVHIGPGVYSASNRNEYQELIK
jgi:hypothetical protein